MVLVGTPLGFPRYNNSGSIGANFHRVPCPLLSASSHVPQQSVELEHELAAHRSAVLSAALASYGLVGNLAR